MSEEVTIKSWKTPVSHLLGLMMDSLSDKDSVLQITLTGLDTSAKTIKFTYCFEFTRLAGYRNLLEEYRLKLWKHMWDTLKLEGRTTFIVISSDWINSLKEVEPPLLFHNENLKHYLICTADDVIDVLSPLNQP